MKKLVYVYVLVALTVWGCEIFPDQGSSDIEFTIFNETDKNVKVLGFDSKNELTGIIYDQPERANIITISPNSKFSVTRVTGLDNDTRFGFYSISGVDSVRMVFDDEKVKVFKRIPPNPCNICDGDDNEQYFITEEDCNSATPCSLCD